MFTSPGIVPKSLNWIPAKKITEPISHSISNVATHFFFSSILSRVADRSNRFVNTLRDKHHFNNIVQMIQKKELKYAKFNFTVERKLIIQFQLFFWQYNGPEFHLFPMRVKLRQKTTKSFKNIEGIIGPINPPSAHIP